MNKLRKIARVVDALVLVGFWMLAILSIFAITTLGVACIVAPIFGFSTIQNIGPTTNNAELFLAFDTIVINGQIIECRLLPFFLFCLIAVILGGSLILFQFILFHGILKPIKQGYPFDITIVKKLQTLGWTYVVLFVSENVMAFIGQNIPFWFMTIEAIPRTTMEVFKKNPFSLGGLDIALVLFLASFIIEYGTSLQTQVDETL